MDRWATKDHYERETEEADRLVRPAPKVKPPRRDKRREDMDVEQDPDIDTDPDVARDPDLSLNYKSIGGRVLARYKLALEHPSDEARSEYLKEHPAADPAKHTVKEEDEAKGEEEPTEEREKGEEEEGKGKGGKTPEFYGEAGRALLDQAQTDLKLQGILKGIADPKSEIGQMAGSAPDVPVAPFLKGVKVPEGIETLGDLQQAALHGKKAPKEKVKGKPTAPKEKGEAGTPNWAKQQVELLQGIQKALQDLVGKLPAPQRQEVKEQISELDKAQKDIEKAVPKAEEPAKPPEKPKGEESEKTKGEDEEAEKPEGEAKPKDKTKDKADQAKKVVEKFLAEKKTDDPAWTEHLKGLPTTMDDEEGRPAFIDPKTKKMVPFDGLPNAQKAALIAKYEDKQRGDHESAMLLSKLQGNPKAKEAVESMFDPESDLSEKIAKLKEKDDLDTLPIKKNLPELADVIPADVKTVGDFRRLVEGHRELFKKKQPFEVWEKKNGQDSEEFKEYAREIGATVEDDKLLFPVGKKSVSYDKLSDEQKTQLHDDFQKAQSAAKWTEDLTNAARQDPDVAHALYQLGNPKSTVAAKLAEVDDINDPRIDTHLPSLRNLAFPPGMTMKDVVEAAKRSFKPVPPPKRRDTSPDEKNRALLALKNTFQKFPLLSVRVRQLDLHPEDVQQVLGTYQRAKTMKVKPEELDEWVKDRQAKGLYTTDPSAVLPPKAGLDKNGAKQSWQDLTPEEQSLAYATHRNEVIGTTLAMREMVGSALRDSGVPRHIASSLALAKLSRLPGESHFQRAERSRPMANKMFDQLLSSNEKPSEQSWENVEKTLNAAGEDPLTRRLAVAQFQANDYLQARSEYLDPSSPNHIDEREPARNIAARIREATEKLRGTDSDYPPADRVVNNPELFRQRVMSSLWAKWPDKAAEVEPEVQKLDADDWDTNKEERDSEMKKWKKAHSEFEKAQDKAEREFDADREKEPQGADPYRGPMLVKSVKQRLEEAGVREPVPPLPLPPKPPGYDLVRKSPQGKAQSGKSLWNRLLHGLTASERVTGRFLQYSSCAPGETMGSNPTESISDKTAVYWGVDPNDSAQKAKAVNLPHTPWHQAHARDLTEKDYSTILTAAREWMEVPVLARVLDEKDSLGAVRDIQFRVALDLAIRDMDGGKYAVGLHPTVYNNLLAQLAGKSDKETLLTQRAASGSLYTQATGEDRPMNASAEIRKFAAEIAAQNPGLAFDLTNLAFRVAEQDQGQGQGQGQGQEQDKKPDFLKDKDAAAKYAAVRGAIIKTAHENPALRPALVPVLRLLK